MAVINAEKLKELRGHRSQQEVADYLGVTRQQIWNYENGISDPPLDKLLMLQRLFGVELKELIAPENFLSAA